MARQSKWTAEDRKKLLKLVGDGVSEQEIRESLSIGNKAMSAIEFAQQLKIAMVEAGQIKQQSRSKPQPAKTQYVVTAKGRLTVTDFASLTGYKEGETFTLEKPRGRSKSWRLTPVE